MDKHKQDKVEENVDTVFNITFAADETTDIRSCKLTKVDVAVQTDAKPSSAIKLMMHEVLTLRTADDAEAYRNQLAVAFELLNLKNASLVHRVEYRKMAKWKPVTAAPITSINVGEDHGCLCQDGSLDMRCPKNFGLHKRTRMW